MAEPALYTIVNHEPTSEFEIQYNASSRQTIYYHNDGSPEEHIFCIGTSQGSGESYGISNTAQSSGNYPLAEGSGFQYEYSTTTPALTNINASVAYKWYGKVFSSLNPYMAKRVSGSGSETVGARLIIYVTIDFIATVEFNTNGGSTLISDWQSFYNRNWQTQTTATGTLQWETPSLAGYVFMGWSETQYPKGEGTAEYQPGDTVTFPASIDEEHTTLYAVWGINKEYISKLTYDMNGGVNPGGSIFNDNVDTKIALSPPADRQVTLPTELPTWTNPDQGYCRGWSRFRYETGLGTPMYAEGDTVDVGYAPSPITTWLKLFAVWGVWQKWSASITYHGNGGLPEIKVDEKSKDDYILPTEQVDFTVRTVLPTRGANEECIGWATDSTATTPDYSGGETVTYSYHKESEPTDLNLYAVYKDKVDWQARLKFDANAGTGTFADLTDDQFKALQPTAHAFIIPDYTPTKEHAAFKGWATSATAETAEYVAGDTYSVAYEQTTTATGITLYAVFKDATKYTATLIYDLNEGIRGPGTIVIEEWSDVPITTLPTTVTPMIPIRHGCTFEGWSAEGGGGTIQYQSGDTIDLPADVTTTLYAIYSANYNAKVFVRHGGVWEPAHSIYIYKDGTWHDITNNMYVRHNRVWQKLDTSN